MRDVHRRDHLEWKYGHPATVDPTTFFPSSAESPATAAVAAAVTQKQPPLDLRSLLGANTVDGGYDDATASTAWPSPSGSSSEEHAGSPGGVGCFDMDDEWDDLFRDIAAGAAIAPTPPSPAVAAASLAGFSGAIGGRVYDADHERASSSPPLFAEVGKPCVEAAQLKGGDCAEVPKAGGGGGGEGGEGGDKACSGGGSGSLGGGVPSHHVSAANGMVRTLPPLLRFVKKGFANRRVFGSLVDVVRGVVFLRYSDLVCSSWCGLACRSDQKTCIPRNGLIPDLPPRNPRSLTQLTPRARTAESRLSWRCARTTAGTKTKTKTRWWMRTFTCSLAAPVGLTRSPSIFRSGPGAYRRRSGWGPRRQALPSR